MFLKKKERFNHLMPGWNIDQMVIKILPFFFLGSDKEEEDSQTIKGLFDNIN